MQTVFVKPRKSAQPDVGPTATHLPIPERHARKKLRVAPFRNIPVNPSWKCIEPLQNAQVYTHKGHQVILDCTEVKVTYEAVEHYCQRQHGLQDDGDGTLFGYDLHLHVGVSALQPCLLLERRARRFGYKALDVDSCEAPYQADNPDRKGFGFARGWEDRNLPEELWSILPLESLQEGLSQKWGNRIQLSTDPGLYLCEYMYYASLANANKVAQERNTAPTPVLFLHIPAAKDQAALDKFTEVVKDLICSIIDIRGEEQ